MAVSRRGLSVPFIRRAKQVKTPTCWLISETLSNFALVLEIDMPVLRLSGLVLQGERKHGISLLYSIFASGVGCSQGLIYRIESLRGGKCSCDTSVSVLERWWKLYWWVLRFLSDMWMVALSSVLSSSSAQSIAIKMVTMSSVCECEKSPGRSCAALAFMMVI